MIGAPRMQPVMPAGAAAAAAAGAGAGADDLETKATRGLCTREEATHMLKALNKDMKKMEKVYKQAS